MKRSMRMTILMLFLIGVSIISPLVAGAELVSHEVTTDGYAYVHGDDHNVFYAQGIYWAFSWKYFYTSADVGATWSAATDMSAGNVTFSNNHKSLAVCIDVAGEYVYIAADCYWDGSIAGAFRRGELHGNGTIDWTEWSRIVGWHVSSDDNGVNANIAVDGTGHYWIGHTKYIAYTTNTSYGYVIGSSTTDGTWTTDAAKTLTCYQVGSWIGGTVMPVGLSSTALVLYSSNNGYIYGRKWQTGSQTWSAAVSSVGTCRSYLDAGLTEGQAYFSAVPYMDRWAQIVYNRSSDNYLIHTYYDSTLALFATSEFEHQMQTATSTSTWPCISISSLSDNLYVWWVGTPLANHLYYKVRDSNLVWQSVVDLGEESAGFYDTWHISAIETTGEDSLSVIYRSGDQHLRFDRLYGNETGSLPYGIAIDPSDVTATSATLNGLCTWSGGSGANATFVWQESGLAPVEVDMGAVGTGEYFDAAISGLAPESLHWFYVKFENGGGNYSSNTKFFYTLAGGGPSAPMVVTVPADHVTSSSAWMQGYLAYDGELECFGGFDLRVQGASTWIRSWYAFTNVWPFNTDRPLRSPVTFCVAVSNLAIDTTYEYRALAKNSLTEPAVVYGDTLTFTTGHVTVGTPTPGPGIELPPWLTFPFSISNTVKTILGIIFTVAGMILIVFGVRSTGGMLAAAAYGLGMTIVFTVIGWYPLWIILLIGAIVGLLTFLIVLGGRK